MINIRKPSVFSLLVAFAVSLPIIIMAIILARYSVNVPWWDQISFVKLMGMLNDGSLNFRDLWIQHNEHRILVPQGFELLIGKVTGFDFRVFVLMSIVFALTTFAMLANMTKRTISNKKLAAILMVPVSWILFSPVQWINWIWGFQLCFFMGVSLSVMTVYLLTRGLPKLSSLSFYLSILTAALGTYTLGNGMTIWAVGFAILVTTRAGLRRIIEWSLAAGFVLATYFYHFHRSPDSMHLSEIVKQPVAVLKYILGYLGRNLSITPIGSRWAGAVVLVLLACASFYVYKLGKIKNIVGWLGLASYALLTAVLASISRLNFGINHSQGSSYTTISAIFIISTIIIVVYAGTLYMAKPAVKKLPQYLCMFFALGFLLFPAVNSFAGNYTDGLAKLKDLSKHHQKVQKCVYTVKSPTDNCLLIVYPDKKTAWDNIQVLKRLEWGDFSK